MTNPPPRQSRPGRRPLPPPLPMPEPGLWRRTPPAIFPPILGLFGLGLAWRAAGPALGVPGGIGDLILGGVALLYLFALVAWAAKPARRPGVVLDELQALPGRAGLAALTLSALLLAAAVVPVHAPLAAALSLFALGAHALLTALFTFHLIHGHTDSAEVRTVTPVHHLVFVGFVLWPLSAIPLGWAGAATLVLWLMIPVAGTIWALSLWQLTRRIPPAPLRPLLAIHAAPAAIFATVGAELGMAALAQGFALLAVGIALALGAAGRWVLASGVSPFWGALTFPLAACATAVLSLPAVGGPTLLAGAVLLAGATLLNPFVAWRVLGAWAQGGLAERTNAARV